YSSRFFTPVCLKMDSRSFAIFNTFESISITLSVPSVKYAPLSSNATNSATFTALPTYISRIAYSSKLANCVMIFVINTDLPAPDCPVTNIWFAWLFILAVKKPVYESPKNTLSSLFICSIILSACTLNDFNSVSYNNNNITLPLSDEIGLIVTSQFNARSKVDSNFLISLYCALLRNFKRIFAYF